MDVEQVWLCGKLDPMIPKADNRSKGFFNSSSTRKPGISLMIIVRNCVGLVNPTPHRLFQLAFILVCASSTKANASLDGSTSNLSSTPLETGISSRHPNQQHDPMWVHRLIFASLNGLLFLLGLANVLVLFIVSRYRRMRTVTNILIFNLCLADLIYISFLPVVIMFQLLRDWMFGIVACKLFYITESTAKYASVYFVGVLSLDRYFALCHPQVCKRYRRPNLALLVSAIGWLVTAVLMTPIYLYSTVIPRGDERFCTVAWPNDNGMADQESIIFPDHNWTETYLDGNYTYLMSNLTDECSDSNETCLSSGSPMMAYGPPSGQFYFITLTFVFCFGIPALVILFFYFRVLEQLFQASHRAERLKKRREKTYRKVTRMVLAVISFYLICWLPYWIQFLVVTFAAFSLNNALKIFFNTIHLLPYLNCAMNPILYSLMTDNFRRILGELFPISSLCAMCCGRRQKAKTSKSNAHHGGTALVDKPTIHGQNAIVGGDEDEKGVLLHGNGETGFMSVSASISPSIRMVSDFSINLLMMRGTSKEEMICSASATSINSL